MKAVALLRGINVGGKHPIAMAQLKRLFETLGFTQVTTYINSGNVLFTDERSQDREKQGQRITAAIKESFGWAVPVLVLSQSEMQAIHDCLPETCRTDQTRRCEVLYLWPELSADIALSALPIREGIDTVYPAPGALIWQVDRTQMGKSGLMKLPAHPLYQQMTLRNANTTRKLVKMMLE